MEKTKIDSLTSFLLDNKVFFTLFLVVISVVAGVNATGLMIEPDFSALISEDGAYNTNQRFIEQTFQQNNAVILYYTLDEDSILKDRPSSIQSEAFTQHVENIQNGIRESQYVVGVGNVSFSEGNTAASIPVSLYVPNEINAFAGVKDELEQYVSEISPPPGVSVTISGLPTILDRTATLLITDNLTTIILTVILVFLVLYTYFQNIYLALIGISTPLLSIVSLAAVMAVLEIPVTLTLAAVGVLMIGLGADYGIHITVAFERLVSEGRTNREAILETVNELAIPISASFLTTLSGFIALTLGVSPSSIAQGVVLSIGITLVYIFSLLTLPLLLSYLPQSYEVNTNSFFVRIRNALASIGVYQGKNPKKVISIVVLITIILGYGLTYTSFSTSNSNWIPEDDPVSRSFEDYTNKFGNSDSISLLVFAKDDDLRDVDVVREIQQIETQLRGIHFVDSVSSPFSNTELSKPSIYEVAEEKSDMFNRDYTFTQINVRSEFFEVDESGSSVILSEVNNILENRQPYTIDISLYGDVVRFEELGQSLQQDTGVTTGIGLALIFAVSSIIYASITIGVTALFPILLAVIWGVGLMGYFGVPFTSLSTGLISLVLGIGVDFSIHLVDSINRIFDKTKDVSKAIRQTLIGSGNAILLTSLTTFLGFLALSFSSLLGTQRFGWSLALSIVGVFGVCILLVPAILSIQLQHKMEENK